MSPGLPQSNRFLYLTRHGEASPDESVRNYGSNRCPVIRW
jgi:hypothetical protein